VLGQLRTFNNRRGEGAKLVITVYAKEIFLCSEEDSNLVQLSGTLCKAPNLRSTPMGRDICDLMLAVNRRYGRSDYLPCIAWGSLAHRCAEKTTGDRIGLSGRLQSRAYQKRLGEQNLQRTAFEVSVMSLSGDEDPYLAFMASL
jgi:single-stranded DNA-binding protein